MKSKLFLLGAATLLLASCSNELDVPVDQAVVGGDTTPLSINVLANPTTKALVEGNSITSGQIGVKLVDNTGTTYDSQTYNNIFYNTTDGNAWTVDSEHKILLSATEGKAYAYYPYTANAELDFTAIPVSSAANPDEQIDYMYGNEATGLKNSNPSANFTMSHAMSIVNFTIAKGTYTGAGAITSVKMKGNTASNTGTMNAVAGTVTATNAGYEFTSTNSLTLGSATGKFIVVPSGTSSKLDFKVTMDGQTYTASTAAVELEKGQVYKYTLTMNSTGLTVSTVTVTPWGDPQNIGTGSGDAELYVSLADKMKKKFEGVTTDGVYAVKADGSPVAYAEASDESYAAVAFVLNGKAYQIAKVDATGEDGNETVYWSKNTQTDIEGLANRTTLDGSSSYARLVSETKAAPPYGGAYVNTNWTVWLTYGENVALADMDGYNNTVKIMAAQSNGTEAYTIGKVVKTFRENNEFNEGKTDWFIPSCGQLAFMGLKIAKINNLLGKANGTIMSLSSGVFWCSSTVQNANNAWSYGYKDDEDDVHICVTYKGKNTESRARLIREI